MGTSTSTFAPDLRINPQQRQHTAFNLQHQMATTIGSGQTYSDVTTAGGLGSDADAQQQLHDTITASSSNDSSGSHGSSGVLPQQQQQQQQQQHQHQQQSSDTQEHYV